MCEICPKFKYAERHQIKCVKQSFYKCAVFLLFWLLSTLWIYHFHCYSVSFLSLYLSFHFDSQHRHPDSPHFSHFHPDSPHSHADSPNPHSKFSSMFMIPISKWVCVVVISEFEITLHCTIVDFVIIIYMYFCFLNEALF